MNPAHARFFLGLFSPGLVSVARLPLRGMKADEEDITSVVNRALNFPPLGSEFPPHVVG